MNVLEWIVVGLIAGWLAVQVMKGGGYGVLVDIVDGVLTLRTAKTGTDVRVPPPARCISELDDLPASNGFYFWSGRGTKKSCVGDYQRAFKKLYKLAGVNGGRAHRPRDTFSVELLLKGVPLADVSALLGHASTKITEKH